jgi:hypothetical protein
MPKNSKETVGLRIHSGLLSRRNEWLLQYFRFYFAYQNFQLPARMQVADEPTGITLYVGVFS